jgi:hypothetical protein
MLKKTFAFATVAAVVLTVAASGYDSCTRRDPRRCRHSHRGRIVQDARKGPRRCRTRDHAEGRRPVHGFAPTDEAFAKLPDGTLETLLKPENKEKLRRILTYHVVPARSWPRTW